jgi:hypothetical protein
VAANTHKITAPPSAERRLRIIFSIVFTPSLFLSKKGQPLDGYDGSSLADASAMKLIDFCLALVTFSLSLQLPRKSQIEDS